MKTRTTLEVSSKLAKQIKALAIKEKRTIKVMTEILIHDGMQSRMAKK